jgi:hypothetical protein
MNDYIARLMADDHAGDLLGEADRGRLAGTVRRAAREEAACERAARERAARAGQRPTPAPAPSLPACGTTGTSRSAAW